MPAAEIDLFDLLTADDTAEEIEARENASRDEREAARLAAARAGADLAFRARYLTGLLVYDAKRETRQGEKARRYCRFD